MQGLIILCSLVISVVALPAKLPGHELLFLNDGHDALHAHVDHGHDDPLIALPSDLSNNFAGYNYEEPRGYNYDPPAVPSGLYETPVTTTTTTTTTTTPPPPPPAAYLPPDNVVPRPNEPIPVFALPPSKPDTQTAMPMPYNIGWGVDDGEYGVQMNHVEDSDGTNVNGEYSVLLPDGRLQIVRFTSDPVNGYQAEVIYQ